MMAKWVHSLAIRSGVRVLMALMIAVAPALWVTTASPAVVSVPVGPVEENEEQETTTTESAVEWIAPSRNERSVPAAAVARLLGLPVDSAPPAPPSLPRSAALDPFNNGLGSHYRC